MPSSEQRKYSRNKNPSEYSGGFLFYEKYFEINVRDLTMHAITVDSGAPARSDLGSTVSAKCPLYPISRSLMRSDSSGMVPSPGKSPTLPSSLSERYTSHIVEPSRMSVFMRSTPLSGSTFSIESAVCSVIFLMVSGLASPYSDMI